LQENQNTTFHSEQTEKENRGELLNISSSPKSTYAQIESIVNTFDLPPQTAFRKDIYQIHLLNLRDQLRTKIYGSATGGRLYKDLPDILKTVKANKSMLKNTSPSLRAKSKQFNQTNNECKKLRKTKWVN